MEFLPIQKHNILSEFYITNGLEVSNDIEKDDGAIYSICLSINGKIAAAATLSYRKETFILDYIAVIVSERKNGIGKKAIGLIIEKARALGAEKIYISAKEPLFFSSVGFKNGAPPSYDINRDCKKCSKLGVSCNPVPMVLEI